MARFSAIKVIQAATQERPVDPHSFCGQRARYWDIQRRLEAEEARDAARYRPLSPSQVSPVYVFVPPDEAERVASSDFRRFERRVIMFALAVFSRGRGRIPNDLRREAKRLNRAQRLRAVLARGPLDARQVPMPFMPALPEHPAIDFEQMLVGSRVAKILRAA